MSFQLSIPWRVALQQSSPLLPQLGVMLQPITPVRRVIFSERQPGSFCTVSTEGVTPAAMPLQGVFTMLCPRNSMSCPKFSQVGTARVHIFEQGNLLGRRQAD